MRIDKDFIDFLKLQVEALDPHAQVFLFGSRLHNHLHGGDIDLLVLSDLISFSQKVDILIQLKMKFGDQKIDLAVHPHHHRQSNPFVSEALKEAVEL